MLRNYYGSKQAGKSIFDSLVAGGSCAPCRRTPDRWQLDKLEFSSVEGLNHLECADTRIDSVILLDPTCMIHRARSLRLVMATHKVIMSMPPRELKRADAQFDVERDGKKFGSLEISNGSLVWFPPYTNYGYKVTRKKFHEIMEQNATRVEKR